MTDLHFSALDDMELDDSDFHINNEIVADKVEDAPRKQTDRSDIIDYLAQGYDNEPACGNVDALGDSISDLPLNYNGDLALAGNPSILY